MSANGALVTFEQYVTLPSGPLSPLSWVTSIYDTHQVSTGTALVVPAGVMWVRLFFQVKWESDHTTGYRIAQVRKNGTDDSQIPESRLQAAPENYTTQGGATPAIPVVPGDVFDLWVGQGSGRDLRIVPHQTWFAMEIVSWP